MDKVIKFLNNYYQKAIKLSNDFSITRDFEWTPLLILNELSIQVGHIYNIAYQSEAVNEPNRSFQNLGDELSDVFLQLIALADSMKINLYDITELKEFKEDSWLAFPVLFGQLNEAVMEKYGYRFHRKRDGFENTDDFIKNRICRLFYITYQIAEKYNLDIEQEFSLMLDDANGFLQRFTNKREKNEYIDTYNENHNFIARFEKIKAHQLGLWHDVVGALIFNPNENTVFFQLKNHKHNNVNDTDLLEITAGGHLQAGESLQDSVREIKEETGLIVDFNDMIQSGIRKCDTDNNMVIREFQYYYILPLNVDIEDFTVDNDEVIGFVKININEALDIVNSNGTALATIKTNGNLRQVALTSNNFDRAFINNGVFTTLLNNVNKYIAKQRRL